MRSTMTQQTATQQTATRQPTSEQPTSVPLIDVNRQFVELEAELIEALRRVAASGRFVLGPDCQVLEESLARYCAVPHAIGCASGSDALLLALMAADVGPGDEVIVPSYTFFATASAVARLGAKPVFVDIDRHSYNLDPEAVAAAIAPATKAVIPVHLYGQCAEMDPLVELGRKHGLTIIEDAAQAIGAELAGRRAGALADIGCFSFYPTKNLGGFGDGGFLTTRDDRLAERLRLLRVHGMQPRYHHQILGINSRLDSLQAAVLNVKLPHLDRWTAQRQAHAARYGELFATTGLAGYVGLPQALPDRRHVWNQYVIRIPGLARDPLRTYLTEQKIGTEIYYPIPLHKQPCFAHLGYRDGQLPQTEWAAAETLALPIFPELTVAEQEMVVNRIGVFFGTVSPTGHVGPPAPKFLESGRRKAEGGAGNAESRFSDRKGG